MNLQNFESVLSTAGLFDGYYVDAKQLYVAMHKAIPSIAGIYSLDGERAYTAFRTRFATLITETAEYAWHSASKKSTFDTVLLMLSNGCLVLFEHGSAEILHNGTQTDFIEEAVRLLSGHKERARAQPLEINLIVRGRNGLQLKGLEIKRTKLNLDLFYEDDFQEVDATIRQRLGRNGDKGIILLHGAPGTGKTTYLRYLIGKIKKRVLFLSPSAADDLMRPDFVELLIDNPNTVVVIEDAENIIADRRLSYGSSSVSNLLNISDGLLADFLAVQLICTFNSPLTMVDSALMRKGRLIAKYEFGALSVEKSRRLSRHFGFDARITKPMTIAELANQDEKTVQPVQREAIGFRRALLEA